MLSLNFSESQSVFWSLWLKTFQNWYGKLDTSCLTYFFLRLRTGKIVRSLVSLSFLVWVSNSTPRVAVVPNCSMFLLLLLEVDLLWSVVFSFLLGVFLSLTSLPDIPVFPCMQVVFIFLVPLLGVQYWNWYAGLCFWWWYQRRQTCALNACYCFCEICVLCGSSNDRIQIQESSTLKDLLEREVSDWGVQQYCRAVPTCNI